METADEEQDSKGEGEKLTQGGNNVVTNHFAHSVPDQDV